MKNSQKLVFLSIFIFAVGIFSFFISNSIGISYAVDNYTFPTTTFTTNKPLTNATTKNYVKSALGSSLPESAAKDFEVVENFRTKDGTYPLYSLMKNLELPNKDREKFFINENNTNNPLNVNNNGLLYIISHGYNVSNTDKNIFTSEKYGKVTDDNIKQYITQIAIWMYVYKNQNTFKSSDSCQNDEYNVQSCVCKNDLSCMCNDNRCNFNGNYEAAKSYVEQAANKNGYNYLNYILELVNNADSYQAGETPHLNNIGEVKLHMDEKAKKISTDLITISPSTSVSNYLNYSLVLSDPNNYGAYIADSEGNKINSLNKLTGKFKVVVPMKDDLTQMNLTSVKVNVTATFVDDKTAKSYIVDSSDNTESNYPLLIKLLDQGGRKTQRYTNVILGYVPKITVNTNFSLYNFTKISKVDVTNSEELPNAELEIYTLDDEGNRTSETPIEKWTSGTTAHYTVLPIGKYTLCETAAPEGYERKTECINFEVKADNVTVTVMENEPKVPVPDTFLSRSKIIYIIGGVLVLLGISSMSFIISKKSSNQN